MVKCISRHALPTRMWLAKAQLVLLEPITIQYLFSDSPNLTNQKLATFATQRSLRYATGQSQGTLLKPLLSCNEKHHELNANGTSIHIALQRQIRANRVKWTNIFRTKFKQIITFAKNWTKLSLNREKRESKHSKKEVLTTTLKPQKFRTVKVSDKLPLKPFCSNYL